MANPTYVLISSTTLGTTAASLTISSIPSTYTDLVLKVSAQTNNAANNRESVNLKLNNDSTALYSYTYNYTTYNSQIGLRSGSGQTSINVGDIPGRVNYTNLFGNMEIYIPNYTASTSKITSVMTVLDSDNSTNTYDNSTYFVSGLYRSNTAISSITLTPSNPFNTYSSFNLYGINNS
jgi:hypothetical protein